MRRKGFGASLDRGMKSLRRRQVAFGDVGDDRFELV